MTARSEVGLSALTGTLVFFGGALLRGWLRKPSELDAIIANLESRLFLDQVSQTGRPAIDTLIQVGFFAVTGLAGAIVGFVLGLALAKRTERPWLSAIATAIACLALQFFLGARVTT